MPKAKRENTVKMDSSSHQLRRKNRSRIRLQRDFTMRSGVWIFALSRITTINHIGDTANAMTTTRVHTPLTIT